MYVCVHIKQYPENLAFQNDENSELFTRKVCEMLVYKRTETTEYVKK